MSKLSLVAIFRINFKKRNKLMLTNANRRINCFSNRNYSFLKLLYNIFRVVIEDNKCSVTPANGISDSASFMTVGTETQTLASADISQMETRRGRGEESRIHRDVTGKKPQNKTWKTLVKKT